MIGVSSTNYTSQQLGPNVRNFSTSSYGMSKELRSRPEAASHRSAARLHRVASFLHVMRTYHTVFGHVLDQAALRLVLINRTLLDKSS
jgi:hypothetical protein